MIKVLGENYFFDLDKIEEYLDMSDKTTEKSTDEKSNDENELSLNENIGKKEKEIEKRTLIKSFLDEINKMEKMKVYENFNFFEPLNNQIDFVAIKPITIFEFTASDEVRNIFNKDATENEYAQLLTKKENVVTKEEEKEYSIFDKAKVLLLMTDSTNIENEGFSLPEIKVHQGLENLIKKIFQH